MKSMIYAFVALLVFGALAMTVEHASVVADDDDRQRIRLRVGGTLEQTQLAAPPDFISIAELNGKARGRGFGRGTVQMVDTNDFTPLVTGAGVCVLHLSTEMTLTARDGSQITGAALDPDDGEICVTSFDPFTTQIDKEFEVTGGTGRFVGASGVLNFSAVGSISEVSTFKGTIKGVLLFSDDEEDDEGDDDEEDDD